MKNKTEKLPRRQKNYFFMFGPLPQKNAWSAGETRTKHACHQNSRKSFFHQKRQPGYSLRIRQLSHFALSGKYDIKNPFPGCTPETDFMN